ncbi:MAG TPA: TetR/AcrR family transcriptional regulator [Thermoplasmata archaeon]|nr:TetR/AcrR family transcriptional regulator [Thermoplasmata archaeon]
MPRTKQANEQLRRESAAKILEAARAVYARKGSAATIAEIAEVAGVSEGLPYRYFRSKRALFHALFERLLDAGRATEVPAAAREGTPGERFERLVTKMIELRRVMPEFFQLFHEAIARSSFPPKLRRDLIQHGRSVRTELRQLIVEGQASGELVDGDPDQLLLALFACLDGLGRIGWASSGSVAFPDAQIFLRMFRNGGRAR